MGNRPLVKLIFRCSHEGPTIDLSKEKFTEERYCDECKQDIRVMGWIRVRDDKTVLLPHHDRR